MTLDSRTFSTRQEAKAFFGSMLNRYEDGETISAEDAILLYELLLQHPNADRKLSGGIRRFLKAPAEPKGSSFHIERIDGSIVDFSYHTCITGTPPTIATRFLVACRFAVYDDLLAEKDRLFAEESDSWGSLSCPLTGEALTKGNSELRHQAPSFAVIVSEFIRKEKLELTEELLDHGDPQYGSRLRSADLAGKFRMFHAAHRKLRIVLKSAPRGPKQATSFSDTDG